MPRRGSLGALVLVLTLVGAASALAASPDPPAASPGASASRASGTTATFQNPVLERNFADPGVLRTDAAWYAYATGDLTVNIQVARSSDLVTWERLGEALPRLPFWQPSSKGLTWAPEVSRTDSGYVMYYTGRDVQAGRQCVSTAVGTAPEGPFVDDSETPLVCQLDLGGSIDPYPFVAADGARYLLWKNDGNCCSLPTRLWMQPLTDDGLGLTGSPIDLGLRNDVPWEGAVIEAPTLVQHDDRYYLLYSANAYDSERYAMGYAVSDRLEGPYEDAKENPILTSHEGAAGPGGQAVTTDLAGEEWLLYHAWDAAAIGDSVGGRRAMWLDELRFVDDRPIVDGPDADPQPVPIAD